MTKNNDCNHPWQSWRRTPGKWRVDPTTGAPYRVDTMTCAACGAWRLVTHGSMSDWFAAKQPAEYGAT